MHRIFAAFVITLAMTAQAAELVPSRLSPYADVLIQIRGAVEDAALAYLVVALAVTFLMHMVYRRIVDPLFCLALRRLGRGVKWLIWWVR